MPEPDACLGPARKAAIEDVLSSKHLHVVDTPSTSCDGRACVNLTLMDLSRLVSMADVLAQREPGLISPDRRAAIERAAVVLRKAVR